MVVKRTVGILLFDDVEVLDFAGPFEAFAVASQIHEGALFDVFTVAKASGLVSAVNGLQVSPRHSFESVPQIDLLIIPGGVGSRKLIQDQTVLDWFAARYEESELTATVCTGVRLPAALGLLRDQPFCTHHGAYDSIVELSPTSTPRRDLRFVNSGKLWTSGGISAGIDLSLHLVGLLHGEDAAEKTAAYMEYRRLDQSG